MYCCCYTSVAKQRHNSQCLHVGSQQQTEAEAAAASSYPARNGNGRPAMGDGLWSAGSVLLWAPESKYVYYAAATTSAALSFALCAFGQALAS
eukprot:scaffold3550_cov112-Isochrysis_galbana.AAC.15